MLKINSFCLLSFFDADELTDDISSLISTLPFGAFEAERLSSIKNQEHQKESLASLLCLWKLTRSVGLSDADLIVIRDGHGKPRFASIPLCFSMTHSRGLCAVALSDCDIGIDLEFTDVNRNYTEVSKRFFSPEEYATICSSTSPENEFIRLWTKKEALAKLYGQGLASICSKNLPSLDEYKFSEYALSCKKGSAHLSVCGPSDGASIKIYDDHKEITLYEIQN